MPFFDTIAEQKPTGLGSAIMGRLNNYHLDTLKALGAGSGQIAEIGPGQGGFARVCADRGIRYVAIEPNARLREVIRAMGHEAVAGFVPPIPLDDASVEVVHASHVIEHSPTYKEGVEFIAEARRVVVGGGLVSIVAPDFDHLGSEFYRVHYSHSFPVTLRRLVQLMEDNGLTVVHAEFLSGPLRTPGRWLTQTAAWIAPAWLIQALTCWRLTAAQSYSAKLTFMRAVWVVGRRTAVDE